MTAIPEHVFLPYESRRTKVAVAIAMIQAALARGARCIWWEERGDPRLQNELEAAGLSPTGDGGAFSLVAEGAEHGGPLDCERVVAWLSDRADEAERAGFSSLFIVGERACAADLSNTTRLARYEASLNDLLARRPIGVACLYERKRVAPSLLGELLLTHPFAAVGGVVCDNPHYLPATLYLSDERQEREIDLRLSEMRRRQLRENARSRELERRAELLRRTFEIIEGERRALAREMHDELGQILAAIHLRLQAAQPDAEGGKAHLSELADLVAGAGDAVHSLALELRPSLLDDLGLTAALRSFLRRRARDAGIEIELDATLLHEVALEPAVETACFRIIQEAVTNVVRHAKAQRASVSLIARTKDLDVTVRDDGVGFESDLIGRNRTVGGRLGLLGMAERAALAGGELQVQSSPGRGTVVRARLPLALGRGVSPCGS